MKVVVIGATSGIAQETAKCFAAQGAEILLVGRDANRLTAIADDLRVRGARAVAMHVVADLSDSATHAAICDAAGSDPDVVLIAHGTLPDQFAIDDDPAAQIAAFELNATSVLSLAGRLATVLERRRRGTIIVIGSVAGDRGRRSNYVYGSAKAAVHAYCEGLQSRLARAGVNLLLVKPGWVDTAMTGHLKKNPLFATPSRVGADIYAACQHRRRVLYTPWFWKWISVVVQVVPARFIKF